MTWRGCYLLSAVAAAACASSLTNAGLPLWMRAVDVVLLLLNCAYAVLAMRRMS